MRRNDDSSRSPDGTTIRGGQHDTIAIPLDSIGKLEVSDHRSGRHLLRGILVGIVAFYGTTALIFWSGCGLDCRSDQRLRPAAPAGSRAPRLMPDS
jgi:hypothetical protein